MQQNGILHNIFNTKFHSVFTHTYEDAITKLNYQKEEGKFINQAHADPAFLLAHV